MKVVVAGSRTIEDDRLVRRTIFDSVGRPDEVVHGGARGVDQSASEFARMLTDVDETVFEPDWDGHGKAAGPIRNSEMAQYGDALVAIWDGESSGTRDMIDKALSEGMDVYVKQVDS